MVTPELENYIRSERAKGTADPIIKANLASQGWKESDFDEVISQFGGKSGQNVKKIVSPEIKEYRRKMKWIMFGLYLIPPVVYVVYLFAVSLSNVIPFFTSPMNLLVYVMPIVLGAYLSASFVTATTKPLNGFWEEHLKIVAFFILGGLIMILLVGVIFFATCIFLASVGGQNFGGI